MRDWRDRSLIDSAGMELDRTLLVFDYLNGEPLTVLDRPVDDPVGPSGAAAAFDRETFVSAGGFDENLFAYWEDVDLVLRLHRLGARCALAADAIGDHEHSATLGSGSATQELPDGVRARVRAAQVAGADPGAGGLGADARGGTVRWTGADRSQPRGRARARPRISQRRAV